MNQCQRRFEVGAYFRFQVHYYGGTSSNLDLDQLIQLPPALAGLRAAKHVAATLNAGFTSVRELGGYGIDFSKAVDEGWIPGPHIYSAGAPISQTAGHGDLQSQPMELIHHKIAQGVPLHLADGVEEATYAVRLQVRRGAKVIKVCSTGGTFSQTDDVSTAQFTKTELEAVVEDATRKKLAVAAHAHGTEGIIAALEAGVETIEHGSYLTEEAIKLMKAKGAILIATRFLAVHNHTDRKGMSKESYQKILELGEANKKSCGEAVSCAAHPCRMLALIEGDL